MGADNVARKGLERNALLRAGRTGMMTGGCQPGACAERQQEVWSDAGRITGV
jgi:hypothetical protein